MLWGWYAFLLWFLFSPSSISWHFFSTHFNVLRFLCNCYFDTFVIMRKTSLIRQGRVFWLLCSDLWFVRQYPRLCGPRYWACKACFCLSSNYGIELWVFQLVPVKFYPGSVYYLFMVWFECHKNKVTVTFNVSSRTNSSLGRLNVLRTMI